MNAPVTVDLSDLHDTLDMAGRAHDAMRAMALAGLDPAPLYTDAGVLSGAQAVDAGTTFTIVPNPYGYGVWSRPQHVATASMYAICPTPQQATGTVLDTAAGLPIPARWRL